MFIDDEMKIQFLSKIFRNDVEIKKKKQQTNLALYINLAIAQLQNLVSGENLIGNIRLDSGWIQNIAYEIKYFIWQVPSPIFHVYNYGGKVSDGKMQILLLISFNIHVLHHISHVVNCSKS